MLVIYNPRSKKRDWQLTRAIEIVRSVRASTTPVGMVRGATRENEQVRISTLETFKPSDADMQTTVIIGNSATFINDGKMITPRGYSDKYKLS